MTKANYIIFHPDSQRQKVEVSATILKNGIQEDNWRGSIWVDLFKGNEDPFVFIDPWLYSYCHATQLRRENREDGNYLQRGSWILFCSGDMGEKGKLVFDTVFLIADICHWVPKPNLALPQKYSSHFKDPTSQLWKRHFRYPFLGIHDSTTHTYEGKSWSAAIEDYSFLPYTDDGQRGSVTISELPTHISAKIGQNLHGKRPILLSESEIIPIVQLIRRVARRKIVKKIKLASLVKESDKLSCC